MSFLAESFFFSSRFFGFAAGAAAWDFFADLASVDALDARDSRASTSIEAITILQLNLRIRAPFAITIDVGHESKGQA